MLRQCADAQAQRAALFERRDLRGADDADEARRQAALRRHQPARGLAELDDGLCRRHVFGEIEVVHPSRMRRGGDALVDSIRQAREHGVEAPRYGAHAVIRREVRALHCEGQRLLRRATIETGDVETAAMEELGGEGPHFSETENGDLLQRHWRTLKYRT